MCYHNLPIEFDADGTAVLKEGGWDVAASPPAPEPEVDGLTEFKAAPVTRVAGALEFMARLDLAQRRVHDARTSAVVFRGYEVVLRNRDPRDAMDISSRVCGVCGGVHSTTASMALDMALPVTPPPLGIIARNIAQAAELLYDHVLHLCLLSGPDYSASIARRLEPGVWAAAESAAAPNAAVHGFTTIAELMRGLDPLEGQLYLEAFGRTRLAMEMVEVMVGNYPHPTTMVPGGIKVLLEEKDFETVLDRAQQLVDYVKKIILVVDDLLDFYGAVDERYLLNGERPTSLLCFGRYDDVDVYDGSYRRLDEWASRRSIPPGVIIDGELRTPSLRAINLGIEEFIDHSFYEHWSGDAVPADPDGGPLSPYHPWNKETKPKPGGRDWKERYTWATAPRWDREVVEAGPIARNWMLALEGRDAAWDSMLSATGRSIAFQLPRGERLPEMRFEWRIPDRVNTIERNRARAYHLGIAWLQVYLDARRGLELLRSGHRKVWAPSSIPEAAIGAGFWEAARGALGHWITMEDSVIGNYQMITPSSWNASPRDPWGRPGPYEEAALNTPILEEFRDERDFHGIDLMRAVRSFDPCMPCAVHMHTGGRIVTRDVVSCGCEG